MEQRDILKDQIEQMGKVIAKLLSNFLNLKSNRSITQAFEATNHALQKEANIDIRSINCPKEAMIFIF